MQGSAVIGLRKDVRISWFYVCYLVTLYLKNAMHLSGISASRCDDCHR